MNVLFLVNTLGSGGTERNVAAFCRWIDRARVVPQVFTLLPGEEYLDEKTRAQTKIHCLHRHRALSLKFALRAAREIRQADVDLVHVFSPQWGYYAALSRLAHGLKTPVVYSEATSAIPGGYHRWLQPGMLRKFDWLIANSVASRQKLLDQGVPPERITIVPNGHQLERYVPDPNRVAALRSELALPDNVPVAIFCGRLIESKRVCDLIDAQGILQQKGIPLHVLIVGDGGQMDALRQQVADLKLGDSVQLLGRRTDVPQLLQVADLFVFPSVVEGLPNALVEAAITGLPCVACDIPGTRDVVGDLAYLVGLEDPQAFAAGLETCLGEPEIAKEKATRVQQQARTRFSIDNSLSRLYETYERILGS